LGITFTRKTKKIASDALGKFTWVKKMKTTMEGMLNWFKMMK
jgi:hypothetical protein